MTLAPATPSLDDAPVQIGEPASEAVLSLPPDYNRLRADPGTQFEPITLKTPEPREPSWLEQMLEGLLGFLAEILAPLGGAIAAGWPFIQWVLVAALAGFVIYLIAGRFAPLRKKPQPDAPEADAEPEWRPERRDTLALLEDADALADKGQYDEAARLLLKRSVGQIAEARPEWVSPSSTARELSALPRLSVAARRAFCVMSAAVESSLFALNALSARDWSEARQAYADFALAHLDEPAGQRRNHGSAQL